MQLYMLQYTNEDDYCLDLFVTADSPEAAVLMWRAEWSEYVEQSDFSGPMITKGFPVEYDVLRVFAVQPSPNCAGVLSWHDTQPGHHGKVTLSAYLRR